jgi:hypothetical protein
MDRGIFVSLNHSPQLHVRLIDRNSGNGIIARLEETETLKKWLR